MTFTYLIKKNKNQDKLMGKDQRKNKINGFTPLYFSGQINKNLSKKESFYQYLFINHILTYKNKKKIQQSYLSSIEIDQKLIRFSQNDDSATNFELGLTPIYYTPQPKAEVNPLLEGGKRSGLKGSLASGAHQKRASSSSNTVFTGSEGKLSANEWKKVISKHPLKMFFTKRDSDLVNISQKSSYIVEQIINPTEIKSNKTNAFNSKNNFYASLSAGSQDKFFITYKKSFLSYWLLPLLGLVGSISPTFNTLGWNSINNTIRDINPNFNVISNKSWNPQFIRAESLANLEIGQSNLETDLIFLSNASISPCLPPYGSPHLPPPLLEGGYTKAEGYGYTSEATSSKVALSAELNSKNSLFFPIQTKNQSKTIKGIRSQEYNKSSQSLILTALKYYQNQNQSLLLEKKLKKRYLDLNFNLFNFKILDQNLRTSSNFKWSWFNLALNQSTTTSANPNGSEHALGGIRAKLFAQRSSTGNAQSSKVALSEGLTTIEKNQRALGTQRFPNKIANLGELAKEINFPLNFDSSLEQKNINSQHFSFLALKKLKSQKSEPSNLNNSIETKSYLINAIKNEKNISINPIKILTANNDVGTYELAHLPCSPQPKAEGYRGIGIRAKLLRSNFLEQNQNLFKEKNLNITNQYLVGINARSQNRQHLLEKSRNDEIILNKQDLVLRAKQTTSEALTSTKKSGLSANGLSSSGVWAKDFKKKDQNPLKSINKIYFLMDQLQTNQTSIFNSVSLFHDHQKRANDSLKPLNQIPKLNGEHDSAAGSQSANLPAKNDLNSSRKKSIVLIFKNPKNKIPLSKETTNIKTILETNISNKKMIPEVNSDALYDCIFAGLKNSLNSIINSKTKNMGLTDPIQKLIVKKIYFIKTRLDWQSVASGNPLKRSPQPKAEGYSIGENLKAELAPLSQPTAQNNLNKLKGTYNISDIDVLTTNVAYLSKNCQPNGYRAKSYALKKRDIFSYGSLNLRKLKSTRFGNANLRLNLSKNLIIQSKNRHQKLSSRFYPFTEQKPTISTKNFITNFNEPQNHLFENLIKNSLTFQPLYPNTLYPPASGWGEPSGVKAFVYPPKGGTWGPPEQFSVLIKHGSLRAGNLAVSQLNLNPNFSSLKKYSSKAAVLTASQDSLFNVENKQINLKPLKTAPQKSVSIKKSNLYTLGQENQFIGLSNYVQFMTNQIEKNLNPYKFRLSYLPEINIYNLKKSNNIKGKKLNGISNFKTTNQISPNKNPFKKGPKFEKIFLAYLSKTKKLKYSSTPYTPPSGGPLNKSELKYLNSFQKNLKLNTKQKLKNTHTQDSNMKLGLLSKNSSLNLFHKNNSRFMILKNRLFLNQIGNQMDLSKKNGAKRKALSQDLKVKRRLKKMKCETRRRKKRKIFYPRPNWIVFSLYKKFLDLRYSINDSNLGLNSTKVGLNPNQINLSSKKSFNQNQIKINQSPLIKNTFLKYKYSNWLTNNRYNLENPWVQKEIILKNPKDFYIISKTVLADLRRVLMKSNWLRSYLNPYLDKVKTIYKELEHSSKKMHAFNQIRSFISFTYGLPIVQPLFSPSSEGTPQLKAEGYNRGIVSNDINSIYLSDYSNKSLYSKKQDLEFLAPMYINFNNSFYESTKKTGALSEGLKTNKKFTPKNPHPLFGQAYTNFNREKSIDILEYNRIIYQRIQRSILNIRENLNLNGEIKNRSKKLSKNIRPFIKRDYIKREMINGVPTNQNSGFWSKVFKNQIFKVGRSFVSYGYDESSPYKNASQLLSRNNFDWAVNKTSTFTTANFNSSFTKKLWESSKFREISKSNKTKKIVFNLFMKYSNLFKSTSSLDGYNHILNVFKKDVDFINSKEFDHSKLTRFFYKKNLSVSNPILSYTNYSLDDQLNQVPFLLSPQVYTFKTEQKLVNIENKLKLLGLYSRKVEKNYKTDYFRFLKQELLKEKRFYNFADNSEFKVNQNKNPLCPKVGLPSYDDKFTNIFQIIKEKSNQTMTEKNFSNSANKNKMSANNAYWWKTFKTELPYLDEREQFEEPSMVQNQSTLSNNSVLNFEKSRIIGFSTVLFHFCALISFISLGGVRTLLKFYYILISKLMSSLKLIENLLPKPNSLLNKKQSFTNLNDIKINSYNKFKINENQTIQSNSADFIKGKQTKRSKFLAKKPNLIGETKSNIVKTLKLEFLNYLLRLRGYTPQPLAEVNASGVYPSSSQKRLPPNSNGKVNSDGLKNVSLDLNSINNSLSSKAINNEILALLENNHGYELKLKSKNRFLMTKDKTQQPSNQNPIKSALQKFNKFESFQFNFKNFNLFVGDSQSGKGYGPRPIPPLFLAENSFMRKNKLRLQYSSFVKLSGFARFGHKVSFYSYLILLRSIDLLAIPASFIYKFFEKPGEYVVENLAYSFLVEWSADLSSTIPDTMDTTSAIFFTKLNRVTTSLSFWNQNLIFNSLNTGVMVNHQNSMNLFGVRASLLIQNAFLATLTNSLIKRVLNSSFLIFVQQLCEPDLDYINRQKKAQSIWDIWGEQLKTIAEENSINIYELTTDKEEQIKLLSKFEENLENQLTYNDLKKLSPNSNLFLKHSLYSVKAQKKRSKSQNRSSNQKNNQNEFDIQLRVKKFLKQNATSFKNHFSSNIKESITKSEFRKNKMLMGTPQSNHLISKTKKSNYNYYNWSVNQFLSYQGKDTDLFIDLHPPKTFSSSAASLKYSFSVQQPIGLMVCQIFSGIFYKQISKNVLVIGSPGLEKTLLIQSIAGETELKMITDSAHRYAMVHRGVAVGIKLLKDVFEALSMHTPCLFLIEDIHAIGERRPFLIDEASPNSIESAYNKNQSMQGLFLKEKSSASRESLYKNNKHLLSHYKKPYKEVKGLATNHFSFTFLFGDLFTKMRKNEIKISSNLAIQVIKKENQSNYKSMNSNLKNPTDWTGSQPNLSKKMYSSILGLKSSTSDGVTAPASSPFSVLVLNEASKLKHKKTVKEMPWFGLPGEQFSLISKYNYSIRVKVALLADLVLSNLSVKLDMITDLLVIIDSVKSNRGFAVFATTHIPYILDPALRRPGRFDETISIPLIPGLYSRWANYRSNIQYLKSSVFRQYCIPFNYGVNKGTSLDLTNYSLLSNPLNQSFLINNLINYINNRSKAISLVALSLPLGPVIANSSNSFDYKINSESKTKNINRKFSWKHLIKLLRDHNSGSLLNSKNQLLPIYSSNLISLINSSQNYSTSLNNFSKTKNQLIFGSKSDTIRVPLYPPKGGPPESTANKKDKTALFRNKKSLNQSVLQMKSKNYAYGCQSLLSLLIFNSNLSGDALNTLEKNHFALKWPTLLRGGTGSFEDYSVYLNLFNSDKLMFKLILISLMGVKSGENFSNSFALKINNENIKTNDFSQQLNKSFLFNFDQTWKYGSTLLFNYIQKRQCATLNKKLAFSSSKLVSLNNKYSLMEPPSPPISNILLPTKRFENYKRSFNNQHRTLIEQHNFEGSITEKLQFHQQQRLLKRLYKYPIKEFFRSHLLKQDDNERLPPNSNSPLDWSKKPARSNFSNFNNSYLVLGPLEKNRFSSINKLSTVNWCYRKILYNRHKTYLTNQWWNGLQGEHNAETTFLSDIDWRYTFIDSIGDIQIDFPDSEQFYNPRNRRWILTNGDWTYWFNIQSEIKEIYSHYVYECFTFAYRYLDQNRELIDFYVEFLHQRPLPINFNDRNLLNLYKRFFL